MWCEEKITKSGAVRYIFRERFHDNATGKYKAVSVSLNSNNRVATKEAASMLAEKIEKRNSRPAKYDKGMTFKQLIELWYEDFCLTSTKENTKKTYGIAIHDTFKVMPQDTLLSSVDCSIMEKVLKTWYKDHSYSAVSLMKTVMVRSLKYGKKNRYIKDISFIYDMEVKKRQPTQKEIQKKEDNYLDMVELQYYINKLEEINHRIAMMVEFQALTGLRYGELAALRVRDFDEINHQISINGTIVFHIHVDDKRFRQDTPKNIYSVRWVHLNDRCVAILKQAIKDNKLVDANSNVYHDKGYIFTGRTGNPIQLGAINKALNDAGTIKHVTTHALRHSHISMLAGERWGLKEIMKRVGQHTPSVTINTYEHVTDKMKEEEKESLEKITI